MNDKKTMLNIRRMQKKREDVEKETAATKTMLPRTMKAFRGRRIYMIPFQYIVSFCVIPLEDLWKKFVRDINFVCGQQLCVARESA